MPNKLVFTSTTHDSHLQFTVSTPEPFISRSLGSDSDTLFSLNIRVPDGALGHVGFIAPLVHLLRIVVSDIPSRIVFGESPTTMTDQNLWWYRALSALWGRISEYELDHYRVLPYDNPIKYLAGAYRKQKHRLTIDKLRNSKVLLSYSGGKESLFVRDILSKFEVPFDTVSIFDVFQSKDAEPNGEDISLGYINVVPTYQFDRFLGKPLPSCHYKYESPGLFDSRGFSMTFPIVVIQRLAVMIYAELHGYDYVLFGDEAERHQAYHIGDTFYPTHDFFQTQFFYNLLNTYARCNGIRVQAYTPIANFSQVHMIRHLLNTKQRTNSCWNFDHSWCNQCGKCHRISFLLHSILGIDSFSDYVGYEDLVFDPRDTEQKSIYGILGVFDPTETNAYPMLPKLASTMQALDSVHKGATKNALTSDLSVIDDELLSIWEPSDLSLIHSAMFGE